MKHWCLVFFMMVNTVLMAANPLGRVTSSGPLTLNGKTVPATAVSSLPVVVGDEIATSSSAAMIYFTDKSRATIAPNSEVKMEMRESAPVLRIVCGSVDLSRAAGSALSLIDRMGRMAAKGAVNPECKPPKPPPPPPPPPPPRSPHCPPHDPDCR